MIKYVRTINANYLSPFYYGHGAKIVEIKIVININKNAILIIWIF